MESKISIEAPAVGTEQSASRKDNFNQYLVLLIDLTKRDFKLRYLGSILGSYWNLIHPLMMILIYTLVFSQVMKSRLGEASGPYSYSLYLCSGIFAWNFFSEVVNRGTVTLLDNAGFLKKISIPPYVLYGATFCSALINFVIAFGIFTLFLMVIKPVGPLLYVSSIGVTVLFGIMALGMGVTLGCLNVFLRDIQQLLAVIFQLWFWFTPIVYLFDALPVIARRMLLLNPAYPYIASMHSLLYFEKFPEPRLILLMLFWAVLTMCVAVFTYRRSISFVRDQL